MIHKQVLFNECQLLLKEGAEAEEEEGGEGGRRRKGKEGEDDGEGERRDRMWGEKEWGGRREDKGGRGRMGIRRKERRRESGRMRRRGTGGRGGGKKGRVEGRKGRGELGGSDKALLRSGCTCLTTCVLSCSVMSDPLLLHGLGPARLLCPWDSPGENTGACCHALLQGIFPTLGSN